MNLLVVDNFDSFTYLLVDYLRQAGATCRVMRNNEPMHCLIDASVDGVVLSPGPGTPWQARHLPNVIDYYHQRVPILGICLGHQALGTYFGATLVEAKRPMHGKVSRIRRLTNDPLWGGLPETFGVTRYHSLVLTDLPNSLVSLAVSEENEVMALKHERWPLWGVQFHPEAVLTEYGLPLIKNWVDTVAATHKSYDTPNLLTAPYK